MLEADEFVLAGRVLEIAQHERDPEVWFADRLGVARPAAAVLDHATAIRAVADDGDVGLDEQQLAIEADADDVGGVGTRGSGEGMCLRRWLHDRYARRAAALSTLHELVISGVALHWALACEPRRRACCGRRCSSGRLARRHEPGRVRPRGPGKRGHRGHTMRAHAML